MERKPTRPTPPRELPGRELTPLQKDAKRMPGVRWLDPKKVPTK